MSEHLHTTRSLLMKEKIDIVPEGVVAESIPQEEYDAFCERFSEELAEAQQQWRKSPPNPMTEERKIELAQQLFDYLCSRRKDNVDKKGNPQDPRKISNPFDTLHDEVQHHYKTAIQWMVDNFNIQ